MFLCVFFTETCSAPSEAEYRKIYSDWCHEFEKYKLAMKTWQTKQAVSILALKLIVSFLVVIQLFIISIILKETFRY